MFTFFRDDSKDNTNNSKDNTNDSILRVNDMSDLEIEFTPHLTWKCKARNNK